MFTQLAILLCVVLAVAGWMLRGAIGRRSWRRKLEQATAQLPKQIAALEQEFFRAAASTGKPRGLVWKESKFDETALIVRDRATNDLYAFVPVTIAFEAVLGGDMEHVEAVSNLRCATAMLECRNGRWTTAGRVMFNLEPHEAVEHYKQNLATIGETALGAPAEAG